jgi:hypothetical protein
MRQKIEHATGEVVIVGLGNYLENPAAGGKLRPGIILVPGAGCHLVAPLTTQATFKGNGTPRRPCPAGPETGLRPGGHFWSQRPSYISRLDIRGHIGWADMELIDAIQKYLLLDSGTKQALHEYRYSLSRLVVEGVA